MTGTKLNELVDKHETLEATATAITKTPTDNIRIVQNRDGNPWVTCYQCQTKGH